MTADQTTVHLLRHGEVHNPGGILYGRIPGYGLSELGAAMAQAAADVLAGRPVSYLGCSPLQRAQETAAPVAAALNVEIATDERLIEPTNVFEGRQFGVGDGSLLQPSWWRHLYNPFRPSWGEPYAAIAERIAGAIADARQRADGNEAVLVSHQLPIVTARRAAEGRPLWHHPGRRLCGLASLTSFRYRGDELVAIRYIEPAGAASRLPERGA
ncbi:MAG: histidine phosphatase family protein [Frankiaceae bacterium]